MFGVFIGTFHCISPRYDEYQERGDMVTLLSSDWSLQASDWLTWCLMFAISRNISPCSDPSDTAPARSSALWPQLGPLPLPDGV